MIERSGGREILRHRSFTLYLAAKVLATLAVQIQTVAIGWQVYALTGSLFHLGLIGLSQFAPFLLLIFPAGAAADRHGRRGIIVGCFAIELVCGLGLLAFSLSGSASVWPIFAVLILFGSARAFLMPAQQAILINLVPAESFRQALALSSSAFHVAVILGPTLGGVLYLGGPALVYGTVSALLLLSMALMLFVRTTQRAEASGPTSLHGVLEGLHFVRSKPVILGAISLDLFAVLFGGAVALLPAYARDVLHVDSAGLGILRTAPGLGAALTSIVLAIYPIQRRIGRWMFGGVALFGLATLVLGFTGNFGVALVALFVTGASDMVSVYVRHILVQLETPDAIRGRVSAVNSVFIGASNELGEFESGLMAGWFGLLPAIVIGGVATLIVTGLWARWFPVLSKMDRFPEPGLAAPPPLVEPARLDPEPETGR